MKLTVQVVSTDSVQIISVFWFKNEIQVFEVKVLRCPSEILPSKSQTYTSY